tara:strand:+ start:7290 stop:8132 length:843 start_codon:yes stop_codon:yes gene_type:complete
VTEITIPTEHLLSDKQMVTFISNGFMILESGVPSSVNEGILNDLNSLDSNPGDEILEYVPELAKIYQSLPVAGALSSLLGSDYVLNDHRHCHRNPSGSRSQIWHQDSIDGAQIQKRHGTSIKQILMMYYPQDVDEKNGPTAIIPGSHLLSNHSRDRTASQGNFRHQVLGKLKAGSVILLHYDIWHAGTKNVSGKIRYMLKFLFDRISESTAPSWNHNRTNLLETTKQLDQSPTLGLQPSISGRIRKARRDMWNNLYGSNSAVEEYYDRFSGAWPENSMKG